MKNQDSNKLSPNIFKDLPKIVFFGTSEFAVPTLKSLINFGYSVDAVITQSEKPAGRARVMMPSPVKKTALENNIPVFEPHSLKKDEEFLKKFRHLSPDLCVVAAYGKIIPPQYLEIPQYGFLNIHPSLLPKFRGPSPIQTAIMNGDEEIGVTVIKVDDEMDHGKIVSSIKYPVSSIKGYKETENELAKLGAELLIDTIPKYVIGEIIPKEQNHSEATFTKLLTRENSRINWNKTAEELSNQIRALNPEPGVWTTWNQKIVNIKIAEPRCLDVVNPNIGQVIKIEESIVVSTKKCYLILKEVQLEGKKAMDIKSFVNGHAGFVGSVLQ